MFASRESHLDRMSRSRLLRNCLGRPYLLVNTWIWNRLPASLRSLPPLRGYGTHLHGLIQLRATRTQATGTFFFRNCAELELLIRLLERNRPGSTVDMAILGCNKGAEVYSFSYAFRTGRPDLNLRLCASDISKDVLEFAEAGVYSLKQMSEPSRRISVDVRSISSSACPRATWRRCSNATGSKCGSDHAFGTGLPGAWATPMIRT